jgi:hypothetical protein
MSILNFSHRHEPVRTERKVVPLKPEFIAPPRLVRDPFEVDLGGECFPCAAGTHSECDYAACTCCGTEAS